MILVIWPWDSVPASNHMHCTMQMSGNVVPVDSIPISKRRHGAFGMNVVGWRGLGSLVRTLSDVAEPLTQDEALQNMVMVLGPNQETAKRS